MNGDPPHHTTGVANRNRKTPGEIPKGGTPDRPTNLPTGEKTTIGMESIIETIRRRRKSRSIPGPWRACSSCFISACVISCFAAVISYAFSTITRTSWSKGSALIIAGAVRYPQWNIQRLLLEWCSFAQRGPTPPRTRRKISAAASMPNGGAVK
jgi:hypothetical protein